MHNDIPRRARVDKWSPAEVAIAAAMHAVESAGADVRLTDAVVLLGAAKDSVADFVDGRTDIRRHVRQAVELVNPLAIEPLLQFFEYAHLPARLQAVSRPFGELAATIVHTLPRNPERTVALRKLLEAKDCAVRALLFVTEGVRP